MPTTDNFIKESALSRLLNKLKYKFVPVDANGHANIYNLNVHSISINGTDVTAAILALVSGTNAASEEEADAPAEEPEEEQEE